MTATWDDTQATELPRAFVVPKPDIDQSQLPRIAIEIQDLVAVKASGYKKLRGGVKFVGCLPRNPTGKLLRRILKKQEAEDGRVIAKL